MEPRQTLPLWLTTWLPFLALPPFFMLVVGDTSLSHIGFHVVYLPVIVTAIVFARRVVQAAGSRSVKVLAWVVVVCQSAAFVGHLGELGTAVVQLAQDSFQNLPTPPDMYEGGSPHWWFANITVPALLLAIVTVLALTIVIAVHSRHRKKELVS